MSLLISPNARLFSPFADVVVAVEFHRHEFARRSV